MSKIYAVTNATSSSGKTTTALNLALCLIAMSKKVLLVGYKSNGKLESVFNANSFTQHLLTFKSQNEAKGLDTSYYDYIIVDVDLHNLKSFQNQVTEPMSAIIPFETEFFGFEGLKEILKYASENKLEVEGVLPVFVKSTIMSERILDELKQNLGSMVFDAFIPRNFYLAKQFDHDLFDLEKFTEKAGITYLNLAMELNDRNETINAAKKENSEKRIR
ncbi:Cellulose biosynthesis protein BcsQ [Spirosomataceae bacterium TFI 002]|nr:Cellulose biosynthesis protein BcsQ [Spirosomataceae bacterium TFI 002]